MTVGNQTPPRGRTGSPDGVHSGPPGRPESDDASSDPNATWADPSGTAESVGWFTPGPAGNPAVPEPAGPPAGVRPAAGHTARPVPRADGVGPAPADPGTVTGPLPTSRLDVVAGPGAPGPPVGHGTADAPGATAPPDPGTGPGTSGTAGEVRADGREDGRDEPNTAFAVTIPARPKMGAGRNGAFHPVTGPAAAPDAEHTDRLRPPGLDSPPDTTTTVIATDAGDPDATAVHGAAGTPTAGPPDLPGSPDERAGASANLADGHDPADAPGTEALPNSAVETGAADGYGSGSATTGLPGVVAAPDPSGPPAVSADPRDAGARDPGPRDPGTRDRGPRDTMQWPTRPRDGAPPETGPSGPDADRTRTVDRPASPDRAGTGTVVRTGSTGASPRPGAHRDTTFARPSSPAPGRRTTSAFPRDPRPAIVGPAGWRLRRAPVVVLVLVVLLAGLGYGGYQLYAGSTPDGWRPVAAPGLELTVPISWSDPAPGAPPVVVFGVPFTTAAQASPYPCRDGSFTRAVAAGALIAVPPGVTLDQAATAFARGSGQSLYPGAGPQVAVGPARPQQVSGVTGSRVEATVRTDGSGGCRATDATVQVLVMPRTTAPDGAVGAAVLVVGGDLRGGPPNPPPVNRNDLVAVLDSASVPGS